MRILLIASVVLLAGCMPQTKIVSPMWGTYDSTRDTVGSLEYGDETGGGALDWSTSGTIHLITPIHKKTVVVHLRGTSSSVIEADAKRAQAIGDAVNVGVSNALKAAGPALAGG